jgi:hypothetical protein
MQYDHFCLHPSQKYKMLFKKSANLIENEFKNCNLPK